MENLKNIITKDVAVLAKLCGFTKIYDNDFEILMYVEGYVEPQYIKQEDERRYDYLAPRQDELQEWIRNEFEMHVEIYCNASGWGWIITNLFGSTLKEIENDVFYGSYSKALESGLHEALKLIKIINVL